MLTWFLALPLAAQISLGVLAVAGIVALAFLGKFNIQMGGPKISFGRSHKRNCGDCILLMMGKRERYEGHRDRITNNLLKDQMNIAEQKLLAVQSLLLTSYREKLREKRTGPTPNYNEENKQYRLYQGILGNALMAVKDEIRRSFKENGFVDISGTDFSIYVKDKVSTLIAIGRDHVVDLYPYSDMIVTIEDRLNSLDQLFPKLQDLCFDLFQKAKDIHKESLSQMEKLDSEFSQEINEFVEERS